MNLLALIDRTRRLPLDARYAELIAAKSHFKPRSIDYQHLLREIERVQFKRLRRESPGTRRKGARVSAAAA